MRGKELNLVNERMRSESFECESETSSKKHTNESNRRRYRAKADSVESIRTLLMKSLILAQDERWRRA